MHPASAVSYCWHSINVNTSAGVRYSLCWVLVCMQRSEAERAEARSRSAASVVNIDPEERTRRVTLGVGLVVSRAGCQAEPGTGGNVHVMYRRPSQTLLLGLLVLRDGRACCASGIVVDKPMQQLHGTSW